MTTSPPGPANDEPLDKEQARVGKMFDLITPTYDRLNRSMSMGADQRWREAGLAELCAEHTDLVLDVATGTGDMAAGAHRLYGSTVIGVDLSRGMLATAATRHMDIVREGDYVPIQGDALALPFCDGAFDRMVVAFGIRNMPSVDEFLIEAERVLRRGGRLVVVELSQPSNPLLRIIASAYLTKVLPLLARLQGGDAEAYRYLSRSILTFPAPACIERLLTEHGFMVVTSRSMSLGACHLYVADKSSRPPTLRSSRA